MSHDQFLPHIPHDRPDFEIGIRSLTWTYGPIALGASDQGANEES